MGDFQNSDEYSFVVEDVEKIVLKAIESELKDVQFDERKVQRWIDTICETCMEELAQLQKPFKYIITCAITEKNGAGIHSAHSCYWDTVNDGVCAIRWPADKQKDHNKTLYCIATVYAVGL